MASCSPRTLHELLEASAVYDPLFGPRLSNHLSMLLSAAASLGASDELLSELFSWYSERLKPASLEFLEATGEVYQLLESSPAGWVAYFDQTLDYLWLDAFHPMIRLAHAVANGDMVDVAAAVAYTRLAVEDFENDPDQLSPITSKLAQSTPCSSLPPADFKDLARSSCYAYMARGGFTELHAVTGTLAAWELAPSSRVTPQIWACSLARAVALDTPGTVQPTDGDSLEEVRSLPWAVIVSRAFDVFDEHRIKMVAACKELSVRDPSCAVLYQAAATKALMPPSL